MPEGESQGNYTELSPDILMFNILPRLPAKSVGRFRCVSREWQSFLTNPHHFAKMHLHHVTNDDHQNHQKLLLLSTTTPYTFRTFDCETPNKDGLSASRPLPFKEVGSCRSVHMRTVASLHGLVCIKNFWYSDDSARHADLILWNPLTNDYKTLSRPTSHDDYLNFSYYQGEFGLYYTSFDDDYKLLHVTTHTNPMVCIYSLKSDSWRRVIHTIKRRTTSECLYLESLVPSVLLNEKLYFLKQTQKIYGEHPSYFILMFDTKTEKLSEIATPTLRHEERTECMYFFVQRGFIHLCVAFKDSQDKYYHTMELWRMNGDGDGDWTKLITYSPIQPLSWHEEPLYMMRNGDWLMYDCLQTHVLQRDLKKHTYDIICVFKKTEISQRWKYMETLVSPNQYACL